MQWWNEFVNWLGTDDGWRIISGAVIPFLAIIIAGIVAAGIGRGSTKRLLARNDRELSAAAVAALITAGRRSSVWNSLTAPERQHAEFLANEADIQIRMLPLPGATVVANWADHEILEMRKNSATFSFQAEQSLVDFRDRILGWLDRPGRAKKFFQEDLDTWRYSAAASDHDLKIQQQAWMEQQTESRIAARQAPAAYAQPVDPQQVAPAASQVAPVASPAVPASQSAVSALASNRVNANYVNADRANTEGAAPEESRHELVRPDLVEPAPAHSTPVTYPGQAHPDEPQTGPVEVSNHPDDTAYPAPMPVFRARERINPPSEDF